jgi:hypothetical protein
MLTTILLSVIMLNVNLLSVVKLRVVTYETNTCRDSKIDTDTDKEGCCVNKFLVPTKYTHTH